MKKLPLLVYIKIFLTLILFPAVPSIARDTERKTLHDFVVYDIHGNKFDLGTLKGQKVMVVNTASRCGLTPQFQFLEELYQAYQDRGFVVIGFPANNFMNQEPGTNEEILAFCQQNYGVTFPMMSKISVRGDDIAPVFAWLTQKSLNGLMDAQVAWNFQKFLIDENGMLVDVVPPRERPNSERVIRWLENR